MHEGNWLNLIPQELQLSPENGSQDTTADNNSSICSFYLFLLLILFFQLPNELSFDNCWTNAWQMLNYRLTIVKRKLLRQWNNY